MTEPNRTEKNDERLLFVCVCFVHGTALLYSVRPITTCIQGFSLFLFLFLPSLEKFRFLFLLVFVVVLSCLVLYGIVCIHEEDQKFFFSFFF